MPSGQSKSSASGAITATQREVVIDPASIPAVSTAVTTAAFIGAQVGDIVTASPRAALANGIVVAWARVTAADQIGIALGNITAGAVDPASGTWDVRVERVAPT